MRLRVVSNTIFDFVGVLVDEDPVQEWWIVRDRRDHTLAFVVASVTPDFRHFAGVWEKVAGDCRQSARVFHHGFIICLQGAHGCNSILRLTPETSIHNLLSFNTIGAPSNRWLYELRFSSVTTKCVLRPRCSSRAF